MKGKKRDYWISYYWRDRGIFAAKMIKRIGRSNLARFRLPDGLEVFLEIGTHAHETREAAVEAANYLLAEETEAAQRRLDRLRAMKF